MKNILEQFLDEIEVSYTHSFADKLYNEHPHKYNMYGLKRMLDVYRVKTLGVRNENADLYSLTYPCIMHIYGDFVLGLECKDKLITYMQHGKKQIISFEKFKQQWSGNALVVEETTDAIEPNYREHLRNEVISKIKSYCIPIILILAVITGIVNNIENIRAFDVVRIILSSAGILICIMLMEKQLFNESLYGDRVCSLFSRADCNSILDGAKSKVFGISWSEIGLGYFIANILLLSLFPDSSGIVAVINWVAMFYGIWSIYYQWNVAKSWCVLCVITQVVIWLMGISAILSCSSQSLTCNIVNSLLSCMVFAANILIIHQYASAYETEKRRVRAVQQYRAFKVNNVVAKSLIEKGDYYETTLDDSSIIFGNPQANIRVTILSNPHCNPCARMHKQVENLLGMTPKDICVQFVFSSFNEELEDSSRYLISCFINNDKDEALRRFALWYSKEKSDYENIIKINKPSIHTEAVEKEMKKHAKWRARTGLRATPTVLVNGYMLPYEYSIEEISIIADFSLK